METETATTEPPRPGPLFDEFARGYDFALDSYQVAACAHIEAGSGVLVAAPTGAGKTVPGEFAVFLALQKYFVRGLLAGGVKG